MTKKTNQIKLEHFNPELRELAKQLLEHLAIQLADDFQEHLSSRGQKLSEKDYKRIIMFMRDQGNATLTLSVEVTDKLLNEDWSIAPVSKNQSTFDDMMDTFDEAEKDQELDIKILEDKRRQLMTEQELMES
jgi:hypothetical protein